jgi:hypothetical protein
MMVFIARGPHLRRSAAAVVLSWAAFLSAACGGATKADDLYENGTGGTGAATTAGGGGGKDASVGGATAAGGATAVGGRAGSPGQSTGGGSGAGGSAGASALSSGSVKPRLLTQAEYRASLSSLFGDVATPLELPADMSVGGFITLGASKISVTLDAVERYRNASRAVAAEVFGDPARWQELVACQPQEDLSDSCVEAFVKTFGKRAFRRELSDAEFQQWVQVARNAAMLAGDAAQGLAALTSGFLQSPNFLYRVETNALDPGNGRLKYDGPSMAVRLAYFLTGGPPSAELLAAGEAGELDTAEGVKAAAASMLSDDETLVRELTSFFYEWTQTGLVLVVEKDAQLFPDFDDLRLSMREGTRLFLEKVVLAPDADVRTFFDSDQTFADAALAPIYGLTAPSSGFAQFTLPPEQDRAGILGQAAVIAAHSRPNHTSPTARGLFVLRAFLCTLPEPPPPGVVSEIPFDPTWTTRQRLEQMRSDPTCGECHVQFDPLGLALEHFDPIGQYRETENGLPIDTSGALEDGTEFDGAAGLGKALHDSAQATECLLRNFYRSVNGRDDDLYDQSQIESLAAGLRSRGYVFRDTIADFVASDAFRSAPRVPLAEKM